MLYLNLVLIAMALNVDAVGVGISYGIRQIRLPLPSMLIISAVSMTAIGASMAAGRVIAEVISPAAARHAGGVILMAMGIFTIYQYVRQRNGTEPVSATESRPDKNERGKPVSLLQMRLPGLIIQVIKEPHLADMDVSGVITGKEALLLGLSLSMDSLGAGIAISLLGYRILSTALCVGVCQAASTYCGLYAGRGLGRLAISRQLAILPGLILIIMGIVKL